MRGREGGGERKRGLSAISRPTYPQPTYPLLPQPISLSLPLTLSPSLPLLSHSLAQTPVNLTELAANCDTFNGAPINDPETMLAALGRTSNSIGFVQSHLAARTGEREFV